MSRPRVVAVPILLAALGMSAAAAPRPLTGKQAEAAVRTFEGRPALAFRDVAIEREAGGPAASRRVWFDLYGKGGAWADRTWKVDARTGEVVAAEYGDALAPFAPAPPAGKKPEEAMAAARAFAAKHYRGFGATDMRLVAGEWMGTGWRFEWRQVTAFGAITPNGVEVEVNPSNGRIESYTADRVALPALKPPKIGAEAAITAARTDLSAPNASLVRQPLLVCDRAGAMLWSLMLYAPAADGKPQAYEVTVNAATGAILNSAPYSPPLALVPSSPAPLPANEH